MTNEMFLAAEKRLWSELVRDGVVERRALEDGLKIRTAFRAALEGAQSPGQMMVAVSEILAITMSEMETKLRLSAALQARVWAGVAAALGDEACVRLERSLKTVKARDLTL